MTDRIKYIINIAIIVLMFVAVAVQKDGRIFKIDLKEAAKSDEKEPKEDDLTALETDGTAIINTTTLAKDIIGFGGTTPVKIYVKDEIITNVELLPNSETPSYQKRVIEQNYLDNWIGKNIADAATMQVDAVSGATFTSAAIAANVQRAAQHVSQSQVSASAGIFDNVGIKEIAGLLVILMGAIISLAKLRNKYLIIAQQVLNVVVLGFWLGSFLSLTAFSSWAANGFNISMSLVTVVMFFVIIIMPLFNRKGTYCHIHCPMGSAQGLVDKIPVKKIKIKPSVVKHLNNVRYYILAAMMFLMWIGVGFDLMNYEVFSAFIFESASVVVLVMAVVFLILSVFIPKPYCRFVCPTGALLTMSQKTKPHKN